jgi:hypothetical protein
MDDIDPSSIWRTAGRCSMQALGTASTAEPLRRRTGDDAPSSEVPPGS